MSHWKQVGWDCYRLISPRHNKDFADYDALYRYCRKFGINATQV